MATEAIGVYYPDHPTLWELLEIFGDAKPKQIYDEKNGVISHLAINPEEGTAHILRRERVITMRYNGLDNPYDVTPPEYPGESYTLFVYHNYAALYEGLTAKGLMAETARDHDIPPEEPDEESENKDKYAMMQIITDARHGYLLGPCIEDRRFERWGTFYLRRDGGDDEATSVRPAPSSGKVLVQ